MFFGILILAMLLSVTACGGKNTNEEEKTVSAQTELQPGEPSSTGDGKLAGIDDLYKLTKWLNEMEDS